jgi:hypothetical protein
MDCTRALLSIIESKEDGHLPLRVRLHLSHCASCNAEYKRMQKAIAFMRSEYLPRSPDLSELIMSAIRVTPTLEAAPVSFRDWTIVGIVILAAITIAPLGSAFTWVKNSFGSNFLLPLNVVLGLMLSAYGALFIGTHLNEFVKRFKLDENRELEQP